MSLPFFLYRRLARWITCEFNWQNQSKVTLKNKYEVASFKNVFCHPFYWQVFQWVNSSPKLVVDCGAHCGHFSILADICFQSKFGTSDTKYILVEPNPYLLPIVQKNISNAGLSHRVELKQGLLGEKNGSATLWIKPQNYLASNMQYSQGTKPFNISFIDLQEVVGKRVIDLMKIDIEGGEFAFVRSHIDIFKQVNLIFMELHNAPEELHHEMFDSLKSVGLNLGAEPVEANGQKLLVWQRS
ncbi:MAG: FkbM family methyltransferase [Nostoc sp.]|uniref:FkbM family methyltransferase n=1 Tax=Nostoc sp. TaxID=1180 RepID=UPI002FF7566A